MAVSAVVIADDLSGAVALGAEFRKAGRTVLVMESGAARFPDTVDTLVVNTDSRDDPPDRAAAKNRQAALSLARLQPEWLVKKIASLLRGHIGAEIAAILDTPIAAPAAVPGAAPGTALDTAPGTASRHARCLVAPAAPRSGRTTVNGRQCFAGKPIGEQMHAMDSNAEPGPDNVLQVLAEGCGLPARLLPLDLVRRGPAAIAACIRESAEPILVADAATQEDLNAAVAGAAEAGVRFVAGTYGIGESVILAAQAASSSAPILAVAGSTSSLTREQALYAGSMPGCGLVTVSFSEKELGLAPGAVAAPYREALRELARNGRHMVLRTYTDAAEMDALWQAAHQAGWERYRLIRHIEACVAETVRPLLGLAGGIVVSGGATASAIFRAAGATAFTVEGPEPIPASPVMRIADGDYAGLPCLTKPGAFGEERDLFTMISFLHLHAAAPGAVMRPSLPE